MLETSSSADSQDEQGSSAAGRSPWLVSDQVLPRLPQSKTKKGDCAAKVEKEGEDVLYSWALSPRGDSALLTCISGESISLVASLPFPRHYQGK